MGQEILNLVLPARWIDARLFDSALRYGDPHSAVATRVRLRFPLGAKVMVDAGVRLLCLVNQLDSVGQEVTLEFDEGKTGTMGYLDRMGFFDFVNPGIEVIPERPRISGSSIYRGQSTSLVEFARITPSSPSDGLPGRLADTLEGSVAAGSRARDLGRAAFTVFAELIDNIYQHSATQLDGYAALQVYREGGRAKVAVSDSGRGILTTLRPTLAATKPTLARLPDTELLVEVFRRGISRHGETRGCGLKASADHALRFKAELDVRLAKSAVHLVPSNDGYKPNLALCIEKLPLFWGTHICFDFRLDK